MQLSNSTVGSFIGKWKKFHQHSYNSSMATLTELQRSSAEMARPGGKTVILGKLTQPGFYTYSWVKAIQQIQQAFKWLWEYEGKDSLIWWDQKSSPLAKHQVLCLAKISYCSSSETEKRRNAAKYSKVIDGNLLQSTQNIRLGQRFTFQQDNIQHTKTMLEWLWVESLNGPIKDGGLQGGWGETYVNSSATKYRIQGLNTYL